ncbi:MAG TPA: homocysteine S-methyltransferase family protein [Thermoleophilia bacterium]|nr:homocysteine S-methyltransferase family protein [Thermoleophilia bacterium]
MTTGAALIKRLSQEVLILDGGMGTFLQAVGLPRGSLPDLWSVERPEEVRQLHQAYIEAGADIIFTNTFGASRLRLEPSGWGHRVRELNRAAVMLARAASRGTALVAGDIGPCGPGATTFRSLSGKAATSIFVEQIEALASANVDLLAIETISDLEEMNAALSAARSVAPGLPILASITFTRDGKLRSGEGPATAARALEAMGAQIVGANCSFGFGSLLPICEEMAAATSLPLAMKPSAGVPPASPPSADEVAEYARRFVKAGANLVGGCCGVSPSLLRVIAAAVKGMVPVRRFPVVSSSAHA